MDEISNQIQETMQAAGCSDAEISFALREYLTGDPACLLRHLQKCRCRRLEELHESQRHIDRLDYLIRQAKSTFQIRRITL